MGRSVCGFGATLADVEATLDSLKKVENDMYKAIKIVVSLRLSFVASQVGLSDITATLHKALSFIPTIMDKQLRNIITQIANKIPGLAGNGTNPGPAMGNAAKSVNFGYQGRSIVLSVTPASGQAKVKLTKTTGGMKKILGMVTPETLKGDTVTTGHLSAIEDAARALLQSTRRNTPGAANGANPLPNQVKLQTNVENAEQNLAKDFSVETDHACTLLTPGCFPAGVDICTRNGWRKVETIRKDDWVLSQNENDPNAAPDWKQVEAVFERTGRVFHLHLLSGELIRTTQEHPFWVDGQGWLQAGGLKPGDRLHRLSGEWATVVELFDTGEYEKVYNCRVADWHTYFVGGEGCAVWAHNVCIDQVQIGQAPTNAQLYESKAYHQRVKEATVTVHDPSYNSPLAV